MQFEILWMLRPDSCCFSIQPGKLPLAFSFYLFIYFHFFFMFVHVMRFCVWVWTQISSLETKMEMILRHQARIIHAHTVHSWISTHTPARTHRHTVSQLAWQYVLLSLCRLQAYYCDRPTQPKQQVLLLPQETFQFYCICRRDRLCPETSGRDATAKWEEDLGWAQRESLKGRWKINGRSEEGKLGGKKEQMERKTALVTKRRWKKRERDGGKRRGEKAEDGDG